MVQFAPLHVHPKLQAASQAWWETIIMDCDRFFALTTQFNANASKVFIASLLIELQMTYTSVEMSRCPRHAQHAMNVLLSAMSEVIHSLSVAEKEDYDRSGDHMARAQAQLMKFNVLLDELGVQ